jgi:hypothetical protein
VQLHELSNQNVPWSTASVLLLVLSTTFLADEPTPRAVDENMPVALIATVVVADFAVHPSRLPIVFAATATRDYIFGHGL